MATDAQTLLQSTTCQACNSASPYQLQQMMVALLIQWLNVISPGMATDAKTLLNQAACQGCSASNPFELQMMMVALLIQIVNGGGSGGATCVVGGVGAPVGVPPCNFSVYIQQPGPNFGLWLGDTITGWSSVIAQGP